MGKEMMIVKKVNSNIAVKITDKEKHRWIPHKYEKVITERNSTDVAYLLYDLDHMGYDIHKAIKKFKELVEEDNQPELFFTK